MSTFVFPAGGSGSAAPSGPAGGALTGTYPDPGIAAGAVGTTELADGAVTNDKVSADPADRIDGEKLTPTFAQNITQKASPANDFSDTVANDTRVTMSDALTNTIYQFVPPPSCTIRVYAIVEAEKYDGSDDYGTDIVASFRVSAAGVVTARLSPAKANELVNAAINGVVTIDTDATNIRVRGTSPAGTDAAHPWRWKSSTSWSLLTKDP